MLFRLVKVPMSTHKRKFLVYNHETNQRTKKMGQNKVFFDL